VTSPVEHLIQPGDLVVAGQVLGEPVSLLERLFAHAGDGRDAGRAGNGSGGGWRLFAGMSLTDALITAPPSVELCSFVGLGTNAGLIAAGRMDLLPCHMSALPGLMTDGPLRPDVALVVVSPPDPDGFCHLGVESDYIWAAAQSARVVLAEINPAVPPVAGDTAIPFDRLDGFVDTDRPLPQYERAFPSPVERAIAERVAPFIGDGACLQIGVGRLGEAVLTAVAGRRDLGIHAGMIGDTILEMVRDGVVTNRHKGVDTGLTVAGSILGSRRAVELAPSDPGLRLRSVAHTNDASVIAGLGPFVSVNSAIEVDLFGQVNAEVAGGRYIGGIGGSVDFLRAAAAAPAGRSIVALHATAKGGSVSRIVPEVARVTALRTDVDVVATEYGVAELHGVSEGERARRLIALASPDHRPQLELAAKELGL
jgi:acyl-CoA hydrolase